jgi:hypothetical protein
MLIEWSSLGNDTSISDGIAGMQTEADIICNKEPARVAYAFKFEYCLRLF